MKLMLCAMLCVLALVAVEASDAGFFIPKAFYTLDPDGKKSDLHPVSPHTAHYLRRLRRQAVFSSSSSSSSSSNGGPVFFSSQQVVQHVPDPSTASVASRFGGTSSTSNSAPVGQVISTTGFIGNDGRVHYQTQKQQI